MLFFNCWCRPPKRTPRHTEAACHWRTDPASNDDLSRGLTSLLDLSFYLYIYIYSFCCGCCSCRPPERTPGHTETPCHWRTERAPKTRCPEAWRPFWILWKTRRVQLLGPLFLLLDCCSCCSCCCYCCCCCWWWWCWWWWCWCCFCCCCCCCCCCCAKTSENTLLLCLTPLLETKKPYASSAPRIAGRARLAGLAGPAGPAVAVAAVPAASAAAAAAAAAAAPVAAAASAVGPIS